ncbi:hypothetical protein IGI04_004272 [Brassica rapa subsp. trilocularis]|nr:hypothetical protein IGI04_004272 [Brassica rapa subsp. trilocularis]
MTDVHGGVLVTSGTHNNFIVQLLINISLFSGDNKSVRHLFLSASNSCLPIYLSGFLLSSPDLLLIPTFNSSTRSICVRGLDPFCLLVLDLFFFFFQVAAKGQRSKEAMMSFEMNDRKKIGLGLTAFGVFFSFLGIMFVFDKGLLAMGNILFISGVSLTIGLKSTMQFFTKRQNYKGTISFGSGFFFVLLGWPIFGMMLETYGFFVLFSGFWPTLAVFVQKIPVLGWIIQLPYIRSGLFEVAMELMKRALNSNVALSVHPTALSQEMKSSRMKFAKKLKSIRAAGEYLNQDRILQVISAADELLPKISNPIPQITAASSMMWRSPQIADTTELVENENKGEEASGNEENIRPPVNQIPRDSKSAVMGRKSLGSGFRRPELNSITLFDPKLLEAFELAVGCFRRINDLSKNPNLDEDEDVIAFPADESEMEKVSIEDTLPPVDDEQEEEEDRGQDLEIVAEEEPLMGFEERCPPGGEESVVFYTTSLRGIRKTFDDCNMIRFLLDSFKVKYYERDVSMHKHYRDELRSISAAAEETEVLPPVLFVKGSCIGGAQRVLGLHEQGKFRALFEGVPVAGDTPCGRCDGFRFLMCDGCRGSRRIVSTDGSRIQCLLCNENGLIVCLDCS